jgi:hypothetical protein
MDAGQWTVAFKLVTPLAEQISPGDVIQHTAPAP